MLVGKRKPGDNKAVSKNSLYSIEYAVRKIKESPVNRHVSKLYVYGSCVRQEQTYASDVDLLLELKKDVDINTLRDDVIYLKGAVTPPETEYPEVDMKVVIGDDWKNNSMLYYKNIRREGINIWNQD